MTAIQIVFCTIDSKDAARPIARQLVETQLAACVSIIDNLTSIYKWEGQLEEDREVLMVMKTSSDRLAALMEKLQKIHPYDVPEILAWPVERGQQAYVDWVLAQVGDQGET